MSNGAGRAARGLVAAIATIAVSCTSGGGTSGDGEGDAEPIAIEVVSSRPEYVTGGDALVAVTTAPGIDPADVTVTAGDADVTEAFGPAPGAEGRLVGLVDGLGEGDTTLVARAGDAAAELTVTSHPTSGPLFSGEHLDLVACSTEVFGLAPATPAEGCAAPTEVTWRYVDRVGAVHDLADPGAVPEDAMLIEVNGEEVPFVLRDETGVLNRAVYRITLLEPAPDARDPLARIDTSAWNGRLVYRFGGGCGATFTQGFDWAGDAPLEILRRGYATATATFNTYQVLCNDVISAETVSIVKEHFIETYGEPVHTIGEGGSGGAIQQILLAQNYPGLLDAIAPSLPFPDALSISPGVYDCALLVDYYASEAGRSLTDEQRAAVNGHAVPETCELWDRSFANTIDPAAGCRFNVAEAFGAGEAPIPVVAEEDIYDPVTNPEGRRCTVWETNVAIAGRDPETGFARSGYDNEGVEYGLDALNAGVISVEEFLDLNERIGGFDIDGQHQAERSVVEEDLAERAFATGRVSGPWGGLPETPMILLNIYTDHLGDIHDRVRAFSLLDRLAGGGDWPETASLWTVGASTEEDLVSLLSGGLGERAAHPTVVLDEWLTAAEAHRDEAGGSWADALAATKPDEAQSRCEIHGRDPIVGPDANTDPACTEAYPVHEDPRMAAGAPRAGAVIKCQLVPVEEADHDEVAMSAAQRQRLAEIFPGGVCDWSEPSVGAGPPDGTWIDLVP